MKNEKKVKIKEYSSIKGNVDIEVIGKNKKVLRKINVHNTGTINICEYLRNALAGDYVLAARPGIIVPCTRGANGELVDIGNGTALLKENPKKSSLNDSPDSSWCVLTFLIPSNVIVSTDIWGFRLYSKYLDENDPNSKVLYAEVDLADVERDEPIRVSGGSNLKVSWTLIVKISRTASTSSSASQGGNLNG